MISCKSTQNEAIEEIIDKEIEIDDISSYHANGKLVRLFTSGRYEVLIQLKRLNQYIYFGSDHELNEFSLAVSKNFSPENKFANIIDYSAEEKRLGTYKMFINAPLRIMFARLFERGDCVIFDNETNEYVKKYKYYKYNWYAGPLAARIEITVSVNGTIIWSHEAIS